MTDFLIADISRHNGRVDFRKMAAAGVRAVICRATVGDYYTDDRLAYNVHEARAAGLIAGVYYVTAPADGLTGKRITAQAHIDRFLDAIDGLPINYPHTVDNELSRGQDKQWITAMVQHCFALTPFVNGQPPRNYCRQSWWDVNVLPWSGWRKYPLHAARYIAGLDSPWGDGKFKYRDYYEWYLWQFSADGNGRGHEFGCESHSIDLNRFNGTWQQFLVWAGMAVTEPPLTLEQRIERLEAEARAHGWEL